MSAVAPRASSAAPHQAAAAGGAAAAAPMRPAAAAAAVATRPTQGRYALVSAGPGPPLFFSEGGTYTLPRAAVERAASGSGRLKFESVVVVRDGPRSRAASTRARGGCVSYVPDAWVEAELVEHLDPAHFGGALSRLRVTRIVFAEGEEAQAAAAAAAAAASR